MSKLDDILSDPADTIHQEWCVDVHPMDAASIVDAELPGIKQEIKEVFVGLLDNMDKILTSKDFPDISWIDRAELRKKMEEL